MSGPERLVRISAATTLVGLALIVWSVVVPRPIPLVVCMTLGLSLGAAALGLYVTAVILEAWRS